MRKELKENIFAVTMASAYTYALSKSVITSTVLGAGEGTLLILSVLFVLALIFYLSDKYTFYTVTVIIFIMAFFMFMYLVIREFDVLWYVNTKAFLRDLFRFIRGEISYKPEYDAPIAVVLIFAIALVSVINIKLRFSFAILSLFGVTIILMPILMNFYRTAEATYLFSFCFLVFLLKRLNSRAGLSIIPICAALIFLTNLIHKPSVRNIVGYIHTWDGLASGAGDFLYESFYPKHFSFQMTGFTGDDGRLGGDVTARGAFVMDVYSDWPVYLTGAVKNIYTGFSWEGGADDKILLKPDEDTEFIFTNPFIYESDMTRNVSIDIKSARTATVFAPSYAKHIRFNCPVKLYSDISGSLASENLLRPDTVYTFEYIKADFIENAAFYKLRRARYRARYREELNAFSWRIMEGSTSTEKINIIISEFNLKEEPPIDDFADYLPEYLTLPEGISRVYDLTQELTKDAQDPYETITVLTDYLKDFKYTLTPGDVPDDTDFVDYFLFTGKEGYCTYFASALAVMGRCAGIPTRYMEGYVTPMTRNINGAYTVTTYQAHAWVEVYINGVWLTVEPTPPFSYISAQTPQTPPVSVFDPAMNSDTDNAYKDYMEQMGFTQPQPISPPASAPARAVSRSAAAERYAQSAEALVSFLFSLTLTGIVLALVFMYLIFARQRRFERIDNLPNHDKAAAYFAQLLKAAKVYDYPIQPNETVKKYADRLGRRFAFVNETVDMRRLADIFCASSYGVDVIRDADADLMKACYDEILSMLKRYKLTKARYYFYKYVINII